MRLTLSLLVISVLAGCASSPVDPDLQAFRQVRDRVSNRTADGVSERMLGEMYQMGRGTPQDYSEAVKWYQKAADNGDLPALVDLQNLYRYGLGVSKDEVQAHALSVRAAERGLYRAQGIVGNDYLFGNGVAVDYEKAQVWLRRAADGGDGGSAEDLGYMYATGVGITKDIPMAIHWYGEASNHGNRPAQLFLASVYENGWYGVTKDQVASDKYFLEAAGGTMQSYGDMAAVMKQIIDAHKTYPKDAVAAKQSGVVEVEFDCPDRTPQNVKVVTSSKYPLLDAAAVQAVQDSYFPDRAPALKSLKHFKIKVNFVYDVPRQSVPGTAATASSVARS